MTADPFSFCAFRIDPQFGSESQGVLATAFAYQADRGVNLLVTAWHNVSGIDPETNENLSSKTAMRPDRLIAHLYDKKSPEKVIPIEFPLYDNDGNPRWLIHPTHGSNIDVAALPISPPEVVLWQPINRKPLADLFGSEGDEVFILGFPEGVSGGYSVPIWKRGSIASPPSLDYGGLPRMLVDATTDKGMSGAPVISREHLRLAINMAQGAGRPQWREQPTRFVGIYSGRLGTKGVRAQLGSVWHREVLDAIGSGGRRGERHI